MGHRGNLGDFKSSGAKTAITIHEKRHKNRRGVRRWRQTAETDECTQGNLLCVMFVKLQKQRCCTPESKDCLSQLISRNRPLSHQQQGKLPEEER